MRTFVLVLLLSGSLFAGELWYNGDADGRIGFCDGAGGWGSCLTYDDFIVPVGGWTVNSVYTHAYMDNYQFGAAAPGQAGWEIRSGVSEGNGGTVVASGDTSSFGWTSLGVDATGYPVYDLRIDGLDVALGAGTYWLTIYPIGGTSWGFIETTSGANSIGLPGGNDGLSYLYVPQDGVNFRSISSLQGGGTWDFVMGVDGTPNGSGGIPEPGTVLLLAGGVAALLLRRRLN